MRVVENLLTLVEVEEVVVKAKTIAMMTEAVLVMKSSSL
jgi:hypothetical protein